MFFQIVQVRVFFPSCPSACRWEGSTCKLRLLGLLWMFSRIKWHHLLKECLLFWKSWFFFSIKIHPIFFQPWTSRQTCYWEPRKQNSEHGICSKAIRPKASCLISGVSHTHQKEAQTKMQKQQWCLGPRWEQEVSAIATSILTRCLPAPFLPPWMTDGTCQRLWSPRISELVFSLYVYICVYVYMYFNPLRSYIYTCVSMCKTYNNRCVWLERTLFFLPLHSSKAGK